MKPADHEVGGLLGTAGRTGSLSGTTDHPRLTPRELLAWQLGREHERARIADAVEELRNIVLPPPRTRAQRIAADVARMERVAAEGHARRGTREWLGLDRGGWAA